MTETPTISVGKLRQNPTEELRRVREGAEYVITDRGVSIGRIVPVEPTRWIPAHRVAALFEASTDPTWANDLRRDRDDIEGQDPWDRR